MFMHFVSDASDKSRVWRVFTMNSPVVERGLKAILDAIGRQQAAPKSSASTAVCHPPMAAPESSAMCGPDCYEIEPGRRIHRPWTGRCRAKVQPPTPRQIERTCWHCSGATTCPCIVCAERLAAGERGECAICRGSGKVAT